MNSRPTEIKEPHPADKLPAEKRAELFRLAVEEFSARGLKHASLNRIIAAIGMSKSSFYHYFKNKTDLFQRTLDHTLAPYDAAFEAFDFDTLEVDTFWPALQAILRQQTTSATRSPELQLMAKMLFRSMDDPDERELTRKPIEVTTQWLVDLIRRGQTLGLVRSDLQEELLVAMVMGFSMAIDRWVFDHWDGLSESEVIDLADTAVDGFKRLLRPGTAPEGSPGNRD